MRFAQMSVMVVEDHGFQRRMALRLLAEVGVSQCSEAADGESSLTEADFVRARFAERRRCARQARASRGHASRARFAEPCSARARFRSR